MGGGVDISLPNVSYCEDIKDVHYNPYNTVEFYVGEVTEPQTVSIYTDGTNHVDVTVSEGNKWYSYLLPKDKGLCSINGNIQFWDYDIIKKVIVKANISYYRNTNLNAIISHTTVEASFKGSDTSNVTNMNNMFYGCENLTSLDLSNFDTSNVTNMYGMFSGCWGLTSLDVSNFDTSNVTSMGYMFSDDSGLTSLNVSNFDTSNVTDMSWMFYGCSGLTSLDLSGWDTIKVTNMSYMFSGCNGLKSLDLRNFNTTNVTNMTQMFDGCSGLTSLDLSGWNMSKVSDISKMSYMFKNCTSLRTIRMVGCSEGTINKIRDVKPSSARILTE